MFLSGLWDAAAGTLNRFIGLLPGIDSSGWEIASSLAYLTDVITELYILFPPIATIVTVLGIILLVEVALLAFYWIWRLISLIPGIG